MSKPVIPEITDTEADAMSTEELHTFLVMGFADIVRHELKTEEEIAQGLYLMLPKSPSLYVDLIRVTVGMKTPFAQRCIDQLSAMFLAEVQSDRQRVGLAHITHARRATGQLQ